MFGTNVYSCKNNLEKRQVACDDIPIRSEVQKLNICIWGEGRYELTGLAELKGQELQFCGLQE